MSIFFTKAVKYAILEKNVKNHRVKGDGCMSLVKERDTLIKEWLLEAKKAIEESADAGLEIETKSSRSDFVTNMDREIEEELVEKIKQHFPNDKIVSEEGFGDDPSTIDMSEDTVWFLDPIDGTMNFVLQNENYVVMLAVFEKGIGMQSYIFDVSKDNLYWAIKGEGVYCNDQLLPKMKNIALRDGLFASNSKFLSDEIVSINVEILKESMGIRALGSAGLEAVELIKGSTVVYVTYGLNAWDIAPGIMMIQENGGEVTRFDGKPLNILEKAPLIMGTPAANKDIHEILKNN